MITVERDDNFLVFKKDGNEFYDIDIRTNNGFDSIAGVLEEKQWATFDVVADAESLAS